MRIIFDLELTDRESAFFSLYAGLRMYKEQRQKSVPEEMFSISAAEAYGLLQQLKRQYPKQFAEAEQEYNDVYGGADFVTLNKN